MPVFGDNSDGFDNEIKIEKCLNFKKFENITPNLQNFLKDVFKGYDLHGREIHATRSPQRIKPDFYLVADGISKGVYVSIKKGSGNSVHQESLTIFIDYLESLGASDQIIRYLKEFHYADGTTNNTGKKRFTASEFKKDYLEKIVELNKFFNQRPIIKKMFERFIFVGNLEDAIRVDYVYHGTPQKGVWASRDEIYQYLTDKSFSNESVHFSQLTYQVWNRNINRNPNTENRREQIQIKWGGIENTLTEITSRRSEFKQRGTYEGDFSEKASVIYFNRYQEDEAFRKYLKSINANPEKTLMVRVTTKQHSKLSDQKVMTRADAYCIEVLDDQLLKVAEQNEFYLDEDILKQYGGKFKIIENSGVSIKMPDSDSYQLLKLTPSSFYKLFKSYALGAGASLFCQQEKDLPNNKALLVGWNTTVDEMKSFFKFFKIDDTNLFTSKELCMMVKNDAAEKITKMINSDIYLQEVIFNGLHIYEEPYTAHYFMQNNNISKLGYQPFTVTTGSGRSHGDYTIVLKPYKNPKN